MFVVCMCNIRPLLVRTRASKDLRGSDKARRFHSLLSYLVCLFAGDNLHVVAVAAAVAAERADRSSGNREVRRDGFFSVSQRTN